MKGKKAFLSLAAAAAFAGGAFVATPAQAAVGVLHTLNFSDAAAADGAGGLGIPNVNNVDIWEFTFTAMAVFNDTNGNNLPDVGETFTEYVLLRATQFLDTNGDPLTGPGTSNPTYRGDHELTAVLKLSGTLLSVGGAPANAGFTIDDINKMDIIFDAGVLGVSFTQASFTSHTTFTDGIVVETGQLLQGNGVQFFQSPFFNGNLNLEAVLTDLLSSYGDYADFELNADGSGPLASILEVVVAVTTSNPFLNDLTSGQRDALVAFAASLGDTVTVGSKLTLPGHFSGDDNTFVFFVTGNGQFHKRVVPTGIIPEPLSAGLSMLGLGALALASRRRRLA